MKAMPHLVEMHKKYADKGLVIITVSVDPPNEKDIVKSANEFFERHQPPFATFCSPSLMSCGPKSSISCLRLAITCSIATANGRDFAAPTTRKASLMMRWKRSYYRC